MRKLYLGTSDLCVSVLGLGTIQFGTATSKEDAFHLLDEYASRGGNFIDTANNYAVWNGGDGGESERVLGEWIKSRNNRDNMIVATKLGALPKDLRKRDFSAMQGLSRPVILEAVKHSLERLQVDCIDLLYLHVDDMETPQEETLGTLNELIHDGLIKEIGCSNFQTWRIESARNICRRNGYKFFCAVQQRFSYLTPVADADFFPQVAANGELESYIAYYNDLTHVAHSPLLKGQYNCAQILKDAYKTVENQKKLEKLIQEEPNPNAWVLRYITERFGGSVALLTTSNAAHLIDIMESGF